MITRRSDYHYVTGDINSVDDDGNFLIQIDGGIMTQRENPYVLRGEDVCFLIECNAVKNLVSNGSYNHDHSDFTRKLSFSQLENIHYDTRSLARDRHWIDKNATLPGSNFYKRDMITGQATGTSYRSAWDYISSVCGSMPDPQIPDLNVRKVLEKNQILSLLNAHNAMKLVHTGMSNPGIEKRWTNEFEYSESRWGADSFTTSYPYLRHYQETGSYSVDHWETQGHDLVANSVGGTGYFSIRIPAALQCDIIQPYYSFDAAWERRISGGNQSNVRAELIMKGTPFNAGQINAGPSFSEIHSAVNQLIGFMGADLSPLHETPGIGSTGNCNFSITLGAFDFVFSVDDKYVVI